MILNQKKTKVMIFNFTDKYQFTAKLDLNGENLEVVKEAKLLGVIVSDDLKWDLNTSYLVKKANKRLELLRKVANFSTSIEDKKEIYVLYVRSVLEQSSVVWHSSLTKENCEDLERVQKCAVRIILGKEYSNYENYEDALARANLENLESRREYLCKKFAEKCLKNEKVKNMFKPRIKIHKMETREEEGFDVKFANTGRLKNSAIPYMQRILNIEENILSKKRKNTESNKENFPQKRRKPG